jgi:hypothetical protein
MAWSQHPRSQNLRKILVLVAIQSTAFQRPLTMIGSLAVLLFLFQFEPFERTWPVLDAFAPRRERSPQEKDNPNRPFRR